MLSKEFATRIFHLPLFHMLSILALASGLSFQPQRVDSANKQIFFLNSSKFEKQFDSAFKKNFWPQPASRCSSG